MTKLKILFEDDHLIVCVKPAGVLSQCSDSGDSNMPDLLRDACRCEIFPIHRLDREVSGVMVFAKSKKSASHLCAQVADGKFEKTYLAVVHGVLENKRDMLCDLLFKDSSRNKTFVVKRERKGVRKAVLEYEVLGEKDSMSLVSVRLHTGRTHQIRVQFASRKHPVAGDRRYGAKDDFKSIRLFSKSIAFIHPEEKTKLSFSAEPDEGFF